MADTRPDGNTYIDEAGPETVVDLAASQDAAEAESASGSSVEEEVEDETPVWEEPSSDGSDAEALSGEEEEEGEWDVDDEDWELADGDFTKHYNRVRQQHAAVTASGSSRPPLPTRNINMASKSTQASSKKMFNPSLFTGGVAANPKAAGDKHDKDKSDRATQEQVLDARTRMVLSGLVNRGIFARLEGCISTGKEANVYLASGQESLAVKIYRTSILNFRSRQAYIVGENRFKGEYSSSRNPRKMIRVWAEKELRNLRRLQQGQVRVPKVLDCKENVLVMEFLGENGNASPRLKDADIPEDHLATVYAEMMVTMRRMYHVCRLVHADLSEYNILYHDNHPYIIDVSQSVEHDHPQSFDFLRTDIRNMKDFFTRLSNGQLKVLSLRRTWDFVVNDRVSLVNGQPDESEEHLLRVFQQWISEDQPATADDDAVFMSSYIPRSLAEVYDPERDVAVLKSGKGDQLIYAGITGIHDAQDRNGKDAEVDVDGGAEDGAEEGVAEDETKVVTEKIKSVRFEDEDEAEEEEEEAGAEEEEVIAKPRGFRHEDREAKKDRKKAVKEEQRERRKNKMSKAEKTRLIKKSAH